MTSGSNHTGADKALDTFAEMMIKRMEEMKGENWKKGWFNAVSSSGLPCNLSGRNYSGSNNFFLQLYSGMKDFQLPVFLTFKQAHDAGTCILKGEQAFPVVYWDFQIKDEEGKRISMSEYKNLSADEKEIYKVVPFMKNYHVFNIDQTNFKTVFPEKYQNLQKKFAVQEIKDDQGMFSSPAIDRMFERQEWLCPVYCNKPSDRAFYSVSKDCVTLPMKAQFKKGTTENEIYDNGMEFYSTALHEMTHSTLTEDRLNRTSCKIFGDAQYAKEELVAEMTAAMVGQSMGFSNCILDNNAAYLDSWISAMRKEPKFIVSVMADVNKASKLIISEIDKQNVALGKDRLVPMVVDSSNKERTSSIYKSGKDEYSLMAYRDGVYLGTQGLSPQKVELFRHLDPEEKKVFLKSATDNAFPLVADGRSIKKADFLSRGW